MHLCVKIHREKKLKPVAKENLFSFWLDDDSHDEQANFAEG